jgi:signal-transduction protein with cAMP-binding, CBS, and nucleotidyltransferase domain
VYGDTVIELDGGRRDGLDLRANVIRPLIDVGRVLAFLQGDLTTTNTADRLQSGAAIAPESSEVFRNAGEALRAALWYEFRHASVVRPSVLSAYDRSVLKTAFRSVLSVLETVYCHFERLYAS